ncbi:MAG: hypothetical protein JW971_00070 [Synergistales bacterium]|nr:hypothetical protein [Synergistales bacterium]
MSGKNDVKDPFFEEFKRVLDSTSLVTARMIESITINSQLASSYTPEMQELFHSWLELISREIFKDIPVSTEQTLDLQDLSNSIGITKSTLLSLILYLYRKGEIEVSSVIIRKGNQENLEICHDLK